MRDQRIVEIVFLVVIGALVAGAGRGLLAVLHRNLALGAVLGAVGVVAALFALRTGYQPSRSDARLAATKHGAYLCAAVLALWTVLAPAKWNAGATIAAAVVAIVFDIITVAARPRVEKA